MTPAGIEPATSSAKMEYMRKTARYTWTDYKTNTGMAKELSITPVFGQNTGLRKKLVAPYKQITDDN